MSNQFKLTSKVANTFLMILKNQLVMGKLTSSEYSEEFGNKKMQIGDTLTVRRPPSFVVSDGATFKNQDVVVGSATIKIDKQKHIGFTYTDLERALDVDSALEDATLNAKMAALAQQIDSDGMAQVLKFSQWVGTPGQVINSATDFNEMPKRLDNLAVPQTDRNAVLAVDDWWATAGSFTGNNFFDNDITKNALQRARLPMLGSVQPYMSQSVLALTTGTRTASGVIQVNGAAQNVDYSTVRDTYVQNLNIKGLTVGWTIKAGEVFSIAGVYAVNPRTHQSMGYLQQFVVMADFTAAAATGTISVSFPIIVPDAADTTTARTNTAFATCSAAPADAAAITFQGVASTAYTQNASFHKSAIQYVFVKPPRPHTGEFEYATDPDTGISIRLWAFSDGSADTHAYRADVIYGVENLDPRLGTRGSGLA